VIGGVGRTDLVAVELFFVPRQTTEFAPQNCFGVGLGQAYNPMPVAELRVYKTLNILGTGFALWIQGIFSEAVFGLEDSNNRETKPRNLPKSTSPLFANNCHSNPIS
jgi:hypothetical protein